MNKTVSVKDKEAKHVDTVAISAPKLNGFMAFTRMNGTGVWCQAAPVYPAGVMPPVSCPFPLFQTRAAAISHIQGTSFTGSEALIFHVSE